ncbi:unknown [Eubacterium sp. CAG:786]|nr:unknown [Eubacterium sp. CAG:786]
MIFRIDNKILNIYGDYSIYTRKDDDKTELVLETSDKIHVMIQLPFEDNKSNDISEAVLDIFLNKIAERLPDNTMMDFDDIYNEVAKELDDFITEKERDRNV